MTVFRPALAALVLAAATGAQAFTPYGPLQAFNAPGATSTTPWDVNDAGTIVGEADGVGFVYSGGSFSWVQHPSGAQTLLTGLTADGLTLVGNHVIAEGDAAGYTRAFVLENGSFTAFEVPGSLATTVRRISDNGRYLAGTWNDAAGSFHGFAYDRLTGQRTDFLAEPGRNQIAQGVNDAGLVVGSFLRSNPLGGPSVSGAFVHDLATGQRTEVLSVDGLNRPRFRDINAQGLIAGFAGTTALVGDGTTWQAFASGDPAAYSLAGYGLNNRGTLVGYRQDAETGLFQGWITTAVPEPATWALWGLGLVALTGARRARGRSRA